MMVEQDQYDEELSERGLLSDCLEQFGTSLAGGKTWLEQCVMTDAEQKKLLADHVEQALQKQFATSANQTPTPEQVLLLQIRAWTKFDDRIKIDTQLGGETRPYLRRMELRRELPQIETLLEDLPNQEWKRVLEEFINIRYEVLKEGRYFYEQIDPTIRRDLRVQLVNLVDEGPSYVHADLVEEIKQSIYVQHTNNVLQDALLHLERLSQEMQTAPADQQKPLMTQYFQQTLHAGVLIGNDQIREDTITQIAQLTVTKMYAGLEEVEQHFGKQIRRAVEWLIINLSERLPDYDRVIDILSQTALDESEIKWPELKTNVTWSEYAAYRPSEAANYRRTPGWGRKVPTDIYRFSMPGVADTIVRVDAGEYEKIQDMIRGYDPHGDRQLILYDFEHKIIDTKNASYEGGYWSAREDRSEEEQSLNKLSLSSFAYATHDEAGNLIITDLQGRPLETIDTQTQAKASLTSNLAMSYLQDPEVAPHFEEFQRIFANDPDLDPSKHGYLTKLDTLHKKFSKEGASKDDVIAAREDASELLNDLPRLQQKLPQLTETKKRLKEMLDSIVKKTDTGREFTVQARREQQIRQALAGINELIYQITPQTTEGRGIKAVGMRGWTFGKKTTTTCPLAEYLNIFMNAKEFYENDDWREAAWGWLRNNGLKIVGAVAGMFLAAALAAPSGGSSLFAYMATVPGILIGAGGALVMSRVGQVTNEFIWQSIYTVSPQHANGRAVQFDDPTDVALFLDGKLSAGELTQGLLFEYLMSATVQLGVARIASYLSANCGWLSKVKGTGLEKYHRFMAVNKVLLKNFGKLDYANKRLIVQMMQQAKQATPTIARAMTGEMGEEVVDESVDKLAQQAGIPGFSMFIAVVRGLQGKTKRGGPSLATQYGLTSRRYVQTAQGLDVTMEYTADTDTKGLQQHFEQQGYTVTIDPNGLMTARYQDPDLPTNHEVTITFESTEVAYDTRALEADLQLVDPSIRLVQGKGMDVPVFSIADMDLAVQAKALETLQRKYRLMDQEDGMIRCTDGQQTFLLDPIADTRALRAQGALTTLETSVLAGKVVSSQTPPTLPYVMSETTLDPTVRQAHEKRIEAMQRKRERDGVLDKQVPKTEDLYTIYENGSLEKDARSASFNKRLQEYEMEPITDPATIDRLWEIHSAEGNAQFLPGRDPAAKAREQALDQLRSEGKITAEQRRILSDRGYMGSGVLITVAGGYLIYRNRQWILKQIKASKGKVVDQQLKPSREQQALLTKQNKKIDDLVADLKGDYFDKIDQIDHDLKLNEAERKTINRKKTSPARTKELAENTKEKNRLLAEKRALEKQASLDYLDTMMSQNKAAQTGLEKMKNGHNDGNIDAKIAHLETEYNQMKTDRNAIDADTKDPLTAQDIKKACRDKKDVNETAVETIQKDIDDFSLVNREHLTSIWDRLKVVQSGDKFTLTMRGMTYTIGSEKKWLNALLRYIGRFLDPRNAFGKDAGKWLFRKLIGDNAIAGVASEHDGFTLNPLVLYERRVSKPEWFLCDLFYTLLGGQGPYDNVSDEETELLFGVWTLLNPHRDRKPQTQIGWAIDKALFGIDAVLQPGALERGIKNNGMQVGFDKLKELEVQYASDVKSGAGRLASKGLEGIDATIEWLFGEGYKGEEALEAWAEQSKTRSDTIRAEKEQKLEEAIYDLERSRDATEQYMFLGKNEGYSESSDEGRYRQLAELFGVTKGLGPDTYIDMLDHSNTEDLDAFNQYVNQTKHLKQLDRNHLERKATGGYILPVSETPKPKLSSVYGFRKRFNKNHFARDFPVPENTPVLAVQAGEVVFAGNDEKRPGVAWVLQQGGLDTTEGHGNYVVIKHPDGMYTLYAHLAGRDVKKGDTVNQGDVIGPSGDTGTSTGPHLHFQMYRADDKGDKHPVSPGTYYRLVKQPGYKEFDHETALAKEQEELEAKEKKKESNKTGGGGNRSGDVQQRAPKVIQQAPKIRAGDEDF